MLLRHEANHTLKQYKDDPKNQPQPMQRQRQPYPAQTSGGKPYAKKKRFCVNKEGEAATDTLGRTRREKGNGQPEVHAPFNHQSTSARASWP